MVTFSKIQRVVTAAFGAIVISTACVAAAVGPGTTTPVTVRA